MAGDKHKAKSFEDHTAKDIVKVEIASEVQATTQIPELDKKTTRTGKTKFSKGGVAKEARNQKDPVVACYDLFLKPRLQNGKKLYVFQFPNRDAKHPYSAAYNNTPLEIRIKKNAALVEVDVPINTTQDYDREKGAKWGNALRKNNPHEGSGGSNVGLAAGFGIGSTQPQRPRGPRRDQGLEDVTQEDLLRDWATSVAQEKVLARQTLGGQILPKDPTNPRYLLGTFRQNQLHLTAIDGIVQLRPQFHHIDAQDEVERIGRPREPGPAWAPEARAIHMSIKSTADGEEDATDTIADRLRSVQEELWKFFKYNDEESFEAWDAYSQQLFVQDADNVPKLVSSLNKRQFLDVITVPAALQKIQEVRKLKLKERKEAAKKKGAKRMSLRKKREAAEEEEKNRKEQELIANRQRSRWMGQFMDGANDEGEGGEMQTGEKSAG